MGIYSQFFILFALIGVGYLSKKLNVISNNMNKDLGNLILYVSLPALIIASMSSFTFSKDMMVELGILIIISIGLYLFYILMSYIFPKLLRVEGTERDIIQFMTVFANTGFMGFPVSLIFFGEKGLFYIVVVNMFYDVFVWTFGVSVLSRHKRDDNHKRIKILSMTYLKQLMNPCLIAVLFGFALILTGLQLPTPIISFLDMLGSIASPLAMIFVGSMLADIEFSKILNNSNVFTGSFLKLIVLPLMVLWILKVLGFSGLMLSIPVLATAMPAAASTPLLAAKYENNSYFASKIVFISTLFSAITIPFIVYIL